MKKTHTLLECLFGYHKYSKRPTTDRRGQRVYACEVCKRAAYTGSEYGISGWGTRRYEYDGDGNCIYIRFPSGKEIFLWDDGYWHRAKQK